PAGTVAEQRARLPPPATCADSIEGVWKSHDFRGRRAVWEIFTLEIRRTEPGGNALRGTITNEYWLGGERDSEPGPCEGVKHAIVSMDAVGAIEGETITFRGVGDWRVDAVLCGGGVNYVLDDFTGSLDLEVQEFQTLANDGVVAINEPTVFRRIDCFLGAGEDAGATENKRPRVVVRPPAFYPPKEERGGGCMGG
ncbi:MAG: hypothetical protein JKY37_34255, partial [Nannocystaceae bacterium]|nr:hypothetical protein [Nannocystaceae bacterium]